MRIGSLARTRPMLVRRRTVPAPMPSSIGDRHQIEPNAQSDRGYAGDADLVFDGR
jgi:hypothetical protein